MKRKLYQDDSYLFEFEAKVTSVKKADGKYIIRLDQTAFYPESGGQLSDRGTLDGRKVVDVQKTEDEDVVHYCREWSASVGQTVKGIVDSGFRLANMRKHTGQHILSGAFLKTAGTATVSAHLGEKEATIEIDTDSLTETQIRDAELYANRIVISNQPVGIEYFDQEELKNIKVRKIPDREGTFRIVRIGDHDQTACGGTHLRATGEVGMIKIISVEKIRGHQRFTFLTGDGAVNDYWEKNEVANQLAAMNTCHFRDLPGIVEKLSEQNTELRREVGRLNREMMPYEAERLLGNAISAGGLTIVVGRFQDYDSRAMKELALYLAESENRINVLADRDRLLITVSENVTFKAGSLAKLFTGKFEGKGGGNPTIAQVGRIPSDKMEKYLNEFLSLIREEIGR